MALNPGHHGIEELKIPVPWGHISAKAWGNRATGQPVIAVHGWLDNAGSFDALIPLLPRSLYIVALDVPGHGHSSHLPPGMPYHYIDFVTAIKRVVDNLGWKKFYYMGHSMGAALGLMYSAIFSDEVERLILLDLAKPITNTPDTCLSGLKSGISAFLMFDSAQIVENEAPPVYTYEEALERLMLVMKHSNYPLTELAAKTLMIRGSRRVTEDEYTFNRDQRVMASTILRFSQEQLFDILRGLKCHLLVIKAAEASWFERNADVYEKAIGIYKEVCASFKLIKVSGNHFVHLNQPQRVSLHIGEFFAPDANGDST